MPKRKTDIEALAANIKLLILDVDGVLTDGRIILDGANGEYKAFDVRDGHGIKMIQRVGVKVGIITGRKSEVVERRARELGIEFVHQGQKDKRIAYRAIKKDAGVKDDAHVCFVGDDIVDLPVMVQVGLPVAVADAEEYVKERALIVTKRKGGRSAVREITDMIIRAKGHWDETIKKYTEA